jgi:hypothetical protein
MKKINIIAGVLILVSGMQLVAMDNPSGKSESPKKKRIERDRSHSTGVGRAVLAVAQFFFDTGIHEDHLKAIAENQQRKTLDTQPVTEKTPLLTENKKSS